MSLKNSKIEKFFSMLLPLGAEIITYLKQSVRLGDIDGDGRLEAVVAYKFMGKQYLGIFKKRGYNWYSLGHLPGKNQDIYDFNLIDYTGDGIKDIIVKWKLDDTWCELNVWAWSNGTLIKIVQEKKPLSSLRKKEELYPASSRGLKGIKYGYIDSKGSLIIQTKFDTAGDFQENGLAIVRVADKAGIIGQNGEFFVEPKYSDIYGFKEGKAIAMDAEGKFKVLDESGRVLFENNNYISEFTNGRANFAEGKGNDQWQYGYINLEGQEVIPAQFLSAGTFGGGKAVVQLPDKRYALIDLTGVILNTFPYEFVSDINEGMLFFKEKMDGKFGLMEQSGKVVIYPKFDEVEGFKKGTAIVGLGDKIKKFGVIDKKGNYIIEPKYHDIQFLGEGMFAVGITAKEEAFYIPAKYAIADKDDNVLTDFIYYGVSQYKHGLASAYDDKFTYIIDKQGRRIEYLPKVEGSGTITVFNNIIKADVDYRVSYYDKAGKLIWSQNTEVPLKNGYIVNEVKYKPNRNYLVYYPQISGVKDKNKEKMMNERLGILSQIKDIESGELEYSYLGDFNISFFKKDLLAFELFGYNYPFGAAHGMPSRVYAHINLKNGNFYELKDLFKKHSDYVKRLSEIIQKQIDEKGEEIGIWKDQYKGIKADQPFYVTEDDLHIYFEPYEIAPYAAGFVTFNIPFNEIMDIVDTKGSFWRALR